MNDELSKSDRESTEQGRTDANISTGNSHKSVDFSPDIFAKIIVFMVNWRSRVPGWRIETMGRLTTSEIEGIRLIDTAMPKLTDTRLRKIFNKHLADEHRHASIFGTRYESLQLEAGLPISPPPKVTPQGKRFTILELVAYLEVQEARAIPLLQAYIELFEGDDESVRCIESTIKDEKFHATWTYLQMERWKKEGLVEEVKRARAESKALDRKSFWLQVGAFLRVMPKLLFNGYFPPLFKKVPSPL